MESKNVNFLEKEEFVKFYHKVVEVALDAKAHPGKGNISIEQLMKEANLTFDVEPLVQDAVNPALIANLYAPITQAHNPCPSCSLCFFCAICGEGNAASLVIAVANAANVANVIYQTPK